ncbi:hypothetical protein E2C01_051224 [Portunus trituberculatus]|uniref:Uncharacterized protein n=1 Tax=Portunus trituberculatus TaxID=210409 RepID=A0A5B7GI27_PORTR|nr:hypothetical protein [Portunus trituberculatus]
MAVAAALRLQSARRAGVKDGAFYQAFLLTRFPHHLHNTFRLALVLGPSYNEGILPDWEQD